MNKKLMTPITLNWNIKVVAAFASLIRGEIKNVFNEPTAPEMTAVSYPNKRPPRVAVNVKSTR